MPEPVPSFRSVFPYEVVRRVAVVTGSNRLMARLKPAAVLIFHYVAIGTRERVVAHIRIALAVPKCVHADPDRQPQPDADQDEFE